MDILLENELIHLLRKEVICMPALQTDFEYMTLEEYEKCPDDRRVEVFEGLVVDMSSPSQAHQTILTELLVTLRSYIKRKGGSCSVFPAPFDVKLSDTPLTMVQPDLMIICDPDKLDGKRCNGAPDFIIEIVSPNNPSDDYIRKLFYYKNYGVREYWIVDPKRGIVTVNNFERNILNVQYDFFATIKVGIYEDLYIDFSEIAETLNL
jgi:Uma2 family endonuclease